MQKDQWKKDAACLGEDTNDFFDTYEEDPESRAVIDQVCRSCPVMRTCFASAVSKKETGVWGGIYLERGDISKEFNRHKTREDWANTWQSLTTEKQ
jgi:hypothetical protein